MPGDYSEELVELGEQVYLDAAAAWLAARYEAFGVWPFNGSYLEQASYFRAAVESAFAAGQRAILAALSSSGRLVPEGSEEKPTWAHDAHCNTIHVAGPQPCPPERATRSSNRLKPWSFREPANMVTLHVNDQGPDGIAFVASPKRDATEPYEQYGVVVPIGRARELARAILVALDGGHEAAGYASGLGTPVTPPTQQRTSGQREWRVRFPTTGNVLTLSPLLTEQECRDAAAKAVEQGLPALVESRLTTPWTPSEPAQEER